MTGTVRQLRRRMLAGYLLVLLTILAFVLSPWSQRLEQVWFDTGFRVLRQYAPLPGGEQVVVVGIDEDDLQTFGVPLATFHRQIGGFLQAMAMAGPAAVGLDVVLPAQSADRLQTGLDAELARGIMIARKAAPLVLGLTADAAGRPRPLHAPFLRLAGTEGMGFVFLARDADGLIRRFDERIGEAGKEAPTLAGQLARHLGRETKPGVIQYALGRPFAYIALRQVLAWREAGDELALRSAFGGRVVLLGSVLPFDDQHATPVPLAAWTEPTGMAHGVLIHAQQLRSILEGAVIREAPRWVGIVLALALAATWWLRPSRRLAWAAAGLIVASLAGSLYALRGGWLLPVPLAVVALAGSMSARAAWAAVLAARERRRLRASFGGMVSPAVLEEMLAGRLLPTQAGMRRDVCVLFSDIRSFTTLSETMAPEDVTALLNDYFGRMTRAIHAHGGTLDKFIGDGIMAFFGAPLASANPCADAFAAGRAMIGALEELNRERARQEQPPLAIGIGLHYGPAVIGYIGSAERNEYSAIGDTVNAASRIEGLTKEAGFPLLLSAAVVAQLGDAAGLVPIGPMAVKGRAPIEVFGWCMTESKREETL